MYDAPIPPDLSLKLTLIVALHEEAERLDREGAEAPRLPARGETGRRWSGRGLGF